MSNEQPVNFKKAKEPRNQLELPTLHFVVTDQWTDILSEKAIFAWLKMYSWCDRDNNKGDKPIDINLWEQSKIPDSFKNIRKKLGVGNDTFYNKILKPLWNVGLIDIEEYNVSGNKGTKPMNIIVYKYPQNKKSLAYEPIKEIRNYDADYNSTARGFAKKGGRPKKEGGSQIEHPRVLRENTPGFSNRTPPGSQIEHNNILNTFTKRLNTFTNTLNDISNSFNSSSLKKADNKETVHKNNEEKEEKILHENIQYQFLGNYLLHKGIDEETIKQTILEINNRNLDLFAMDDVEKQFKYMMDKLTNGEIDNHRGFPAYFANGLQMRSSQSKASRKHQEEMLKEYEIAMQQKKQRDTSFYYDWLNDV